MLLLLYYSILNFIATSLEPVINVHSSLSADVNGRVEGRGFHVEGEGAMLRVEGNIFFCNFFFLEKVIIDAINVIKTNKKNLKNKWRVNIF